MTHPRTQQGLRRQGRADTHNDGGARAWRVKPTVAQLKTAEMETAQRKRFEKVMKDECAEKALEMIWAGAFSTLPRTSIPSPSLQPSCSSSSEVPARTAGRAGDHAGGLQRPACGLQKDVGPSQSDLNACGASHGWSERDELGRRYYAIEVLDGAGSPELRGRRRQDALAAREMCPMLTEV